MVEILKLNDLIEYAVAFFKDA